MPALHPQQMAQQLSLLGLIADKFNPLQRQLNPLASTEGARGGGTARAYHGTYADIQKFRGAEGDPWVPDRNLGPHFAADPTVANKFAEGIYGRGKTESEAGGGRVYPVDINTSRFKTVDQPPYEWRTPDMPAHKGITSDQTAIAKLVNTEGFKARPDILERYLVEARHMSPTEAKDTATRLVNGESVNIEGQPYSKPYDLERFVDNWTGTPYNAADRSALLDAARSRLESQGYTGLKYTNTSPTETEGIKDPTTYLPFSKNTVKSAITGETLMGLAALLGIDPRQKRP